MAKPKAEPDYGLSPLTIDEAARVLGIDVPTFKVWLMETATPGPNRWSEWMQGRRTIPERLIRLYLTQRADRQIGADRQAPRTAAGSEHATAPPVEPEERTRRLRRLGSASAGGGRGRK